MIFILPSNRGKVAIILTFLTLLISMLNLNPMTGFLFAATLSLLITSFVLCLLSGMKVDIRRSPGFNGIIGSRISLPLIVKNNGFRKRQPMVIIEECPFYKEKIYEQIISPLDAGEEIIVNRFIGAFKRGDFKLDKVKLRGGDPLGLFYRDKLFSLPVDVMVYPESVRLSWMPIRNNNLIRAANNGRPLGVSGLGQEFFGIREYRPTDGVQYIHWKATAKHKKLMVREFEANSVNHVSILLDVCGSCVGNDKYRNNFEYLVKVASSIVEYLASTYCKIYFVTAYGGKEPILFSEFGDAMHIRQRVRDILTTITPVRIGLSALLDECTDTICSESVYYCLTMSEPYELGIHFDMLMEKGIDIRWIYAPRAYFPDKELLYIPKKDQDFSYTSKLGVTPFVVKQEMSVSKVLSYG